jgi:hypothetical protein
MNAFLSHRCIFFLSFFILLNKFQKSSGNENVKIPWYLMVITYGPSLKGFMTTNIIKSRINFDKIKFVNKISWLDSRMCHVWILFRQKWLQPKWSIQSYCIWSMNENVDLPGKGNVQRTQPPIHLAENPEGN